MLSKDRNQFVFKRPRKGEGGGDGLIFESASGNSSGTVDRLSFHQEWGFRGEATCMYISSFIFLVSVSLICMYSTDDVYSTKYVLYHTYCTSTMYILYSTYVHLEAFLLSVGSIIQRKWQMPWSTLEYRLVYPRI